MPFTAKGEAPFHMETQSYQYDVAFSFLAQDEPIAVQLTDLLQGRLRVFLYSKSQGEIAGTDGEKSFNAVFGEQSRLVVVLYRNGWGQTPWTRIEETAIRNRAFDQGYDFVKFIPLDENPSVPRWLPRTQLWLGLKRWGAAGAVSVIEARVQELGGEPREESVQERAARFERSRRFSEERRQFLNSDAGVNAANKEFAAFTSEVQRLISEIKESASSITFQLKEAREQFVVLGLRIGLSVDWRFRYRNTLGDVRLHVVIWNKHPPFPGIRHFDEPKRLASKTFTFDLLPSGQYCWRSDENQDQSFGTEELAGFVLKYYIDEAETYEPDEESD
jgi:hypothetical protein